MESGLLVRAFLCALECIHDCVWVGGPRECVGMLIRAIGNVRIVTAQLFQEPDDLCGFLLAKNRKLQRELVTQSKGRNAPRLPMPVLGSAAIDAVSSKRATS